MKYILSIFCIVYACPVFGQNCAPIKFDVENNISYVRVKNHALEIRSKKLTAVGYYPTIINDTTLLYIIPESLMEYSYVDSIRFFAKGGYYSNPSDNRIETSFYGSFIIKTSYQLIDGRIIAEEKKIPLSNLGAMLIFLSLFLITIRTNKQSMKGNFNPLLTSLSTLVISVCSLGIVSKYISNDEVLKSNISIFQFFNKDSVLILMTFAYMWIKDLIGSVESSE